MDTPEPSTTIPQSVSAARRINDRWIVRGRLRDSANAYLKYLEATDPERLRRSCELAMEMVHMHEAGQDPKPLFYAGLFGLATPEEARCFLHSHFLTHSVWSRSHGMPDPMGNLAIRFRKLARSVARKLSDAKPHLLACTIHIG